MSWLSGFVYVLGGLVSAVAAVAITAVILLVIGQALVLAYRGMRGRAPVPVPVR